MKTDNTRTCISCLTELNHLDNDLNGKKDCVCARCKAEQAHDFDKEPNVKFDRAGNRIKRTRKIWYNKQCDRCGEIKFITRWKGVADLCKECQVIAEKESNE